MSQLSILNQTPLLFLVMRERSQPAKGGKGGKGGKASVVPAPTAPSHATTASPRRDHPVTAKGSAGTQSTTKKSGAVQLQAAAVVDEGSPPGPPSLIDDSSVRGVSLDFLIAFAWEHDAWSVPTAEIVQRVIVPAVLMQGSRGDECCGGASHRATGACGKGDAVVSLSQTSATQHPGGVGHSAVHFADGTHPTHRGGSDAVGESVDADSPGADVPPPARAAPKGPKLPKNPMAKSKKGSRGQSEEGVGREARAAVPFTALLPPEQVGVPAIFVSHAWSNPFGLVVAAVRKFVSDSEKKQKQARSGQATPTPFVWIDVFAVTQQSGKAQADDLRLLEPTIARPDCTTLVVLDSDHALPLSRIWCIFEIFTTILNSGDRHGKLQVRGLCISASCTFADEPREMLLA